MKRIGLYLVIALGLGSNACAASAKEAVFAPSAPAGAVAADAAPAAMPAPAAESVKQASAAPASIPAKTASLAKSDDKAPRHDDAAKPLLIYEAALGIQVKREAFPETIERSIDVAEAFGGFLLSRSDNGVQLRIPSQSFRSALKELEKLGSVSRRSVSAQDVSEQYHDLEVRLKNLESVRNRLEQFLARAANVSEAMTVGKELENVTRQIDEIKGRMQYLKTRAAYSLVTIAFEPKAEAVVAKNVGPAPPPPPRPARLPVDWLRQVGLDDLLRFE